MLKDPFESWRRAPRLGMPTFVVIAGQDDVTPQTRHQLDPAIARIDWQRIRRRDRQAPARRAGHQDRCDDLTLFQMASGHTVGIGDIDPPAGIGAHRQALLAQGQVVQLDLGIAHLTGPKLAAIAV